LGGEKLAALEGAVTGAPIATARKIAARVARRLLPRPPQLPPDKYGAEVAFRREAVDEYELWYRGEISELYETPAPTNAQQVRCRSPRHSAILTFLELVIKPKYLYDLQLTRRAFAGLRVLDVGAGPMPGGTAFEDIELWCLDPLYPAYLQLGFTLHYWDRVRLVNAFAETMPIEDQFFDVVISVNAIDHVDDFFQTATEIRRVLKNDGLFRMHVHYHAKTPTEPIELNDEVFSRAYSWCRGLRKIDEKTRKYGSEAGPGESYALWGNF
jgi:SAM-dependent methyltransferase